MHADKLIDYSSPTFDKFRDFFYKNFDLGLPVNALKWRQTEKTQVIKYHHVNLQPLAAQTKPDSDALYIDHIVWLKRYAAHKAFNVYIY